MSVKWPVVIRRHRNCVLNIILWKFQYFHHVPPLSTQIMWTSISPRAGTSNHIHMKSYTMWLYTQTVRKRKIPPPPPPHTHTHIKMRFYQYPPPPPPPPPPPHTHTHTQRCDFTSTGNLIVKMRLIVHNGISYTGGINIYIYIYIKSGAWNHEKITVRFI